MATNKSDNRSADLKVGQLWHTIDDRVATDADDTEDEDDVNKDNETMKLKREDMSLFGICPAWDQFYLVVCEYCKQVIKPQALQRHIELRHSYHNNISNQIHKSLKLRTDSTNITTTTATTLPSMTTSPDMTSIVIKQECDEFVNGNNDSISNEELVNNCINSDVKVMLNSNDLKPIIDRNIVLIDKSGNTVDKNCVNNNQLTENSLNIKCNSKLINLLSPNISTTLEPLLPEPTGPGPGYTVGVVSADRHSVTISVPEISLSDNKLDINAKDCESTATVVKAPPKKKSYKKPANERKLLPCKDRQYDANKHCGVCTGEMEKPCTRSLTCKTHSLTLRRAVQGREKNFDELLTEHREAKEAALRAQGIEIKPTKKTIAKQQQQLRASQQLQLKEEAQQQLLNDGNHLQPMRTLVFNDCPTIDSSLTPNIHTNINSLSFASSPLNSSLENFMSRKTPQLSHQSHRKLTHKQIEVDADGSVYMCCHPRPAAVCNYNIRTFDGSRLLSRNHDLTLAALRSTFNSPLLVSKLANNQKCSSSVSQMSVKSPSRNTNQSFSHNKKLRTSIDQLCDSTGDEPAADPYSFADGIAANSSNNYTYVKPKTTIAKNTANVSKKRKKSDLNVLTQNSSLLSNGQLIHPSITTKVIASNPKKKSVVKKNSQNTSISASVPLINTNLNSNPNISAANSNNTVSNSLIVNNSEQHINPLTSLVSETPAPVTHRNLNDILSNSMSDSFKSDNGSILLNGSLLTSKKNTFSSVSKKTNCDIKDSINRKSLFPAKNLVTNSNNNNSSKLLVNSMSPTLTSISMTPTSRPIIQKQTLPSNSVNTLSQSQNMSQISQNIHNASHTIFIKPTKQSLQN